MLLWPAPAPETLQATGRLPSRELSLGPLVPLSSSLSHVTPALDRRPRIAIVIDDLGLDRAAFRRANALPPTVTFALLPYAPGVAERAAEATAAGRETLVHLPMQPLGAADPGPDALLIGLPPDEWDRRLDRALASIPGHVGLNNHMGSRFTADRAAMDWLMRRLKERDLIFLDSRTTAASEGHRAALAAGVRSLQRQVFLDPDGPTSDVGHYLRETVRIAEAEGQAIAIGHPFPATLAAIEAFAARPDAPYRLVKLSRLLSRRVSDAR